MRPTSLGIAFRWIVGLAVGSVSGAGVVVAGGSIVASGIHDDGLLVCVGCTWVFVGAVAFLSRREFGRQILLGTLEAIVLSVAAAAVLVGLSRQTDLRSLWYLRHVPPAAASTAVVVALLAAAIWAGLRLPSTRAAMRGADGGRRTRR